MHSLPRRKFTDTEKQAIIEEASKRGINNVLREHKLSYSVFSRWKSKFQPEEINDQKNRNKLMQQLKDLVTENERLKKIIANQALELQIKTERLKEVSSGM